MKPLLYRIVIVILSLTIIPCHIFAQSEVDLFGEGFHEFRKSELNGFKNFLLRKQTENPEKLEQQRRFDVTYYGLNITIDPVQQTVAGTLHIRAKSVSENLSSMLIDLDSAMTVSDVSGDSINSFTHSENIINIDLAKVYNTGQEINLIIDYAGTPRSAGFGSFIFGTRNNSSEPLIWSLSEPFYARSWWPSKDLPEDKADSASIVITVPEGLTAVSNGTLRKTINNDNGTTTFYWHESYPITTYLISVAVSNYDYFVEYFPVSPTENMPVEYYITPEKSPGAFGSSSGFTETIAMLNVFTNLFGPYPFPGEKYAQVEFGWGGGMEHQTATSLGVGQSGAKLLLVAHELAHQWWGNMVTCRDWSNIWLNEGFATYSEGLYLEARNGKNTLNNYMQAILKPVGFWGSLYRNNIDDPFSIFANTVYDKGAWVLHMLRNTVGDENFFAILRSYGSDPAYSYGTATTEDFQNVSEKIYGDDLDWFFSQWVYGSGRPQYIYDWNSVSDGSNYEVTVTIDQVQPGQVFTVPLEIFVHGFETSETFMVKNDQPHQTFELTVSFEPAGVTLDDDNKVLKRIESDPNEPDIPSEFMLSQNYPNPFNPSTTITYGLPAAGFVTVKIYDILGREVISLVDKQQTAGFKSVSWDGRNSEGSFSPSGVYFVKVTAGQFSKIRKMVFAR